MSRQPLRDRAAILASASTLRAVAASLLAVGVFGYVQYRGSAHAVGVDGLFHIKAANLIRALELFRAQVVEQIFNGATWSNADVTCLLFLLLCSSLPHSSLN